MNDARRPLSAGWFAVAFAFHLMAAIMVLTVLVGFVPICERIFMDFGAELPDLTKAVILASRIAAGYWFLAILPLAADAGILLALLRLGPEHRWIANLWALLVPAGAIAVALVAVVAMHVPLFQLMRSLSG
ncbi:MAG: hypothetical protein ACYC35_24235 [Pirellulales bacterium]